MSLDPEKQDDQDSTEPTEASEDGTFLDSDEVLSDEDEDFGEESVFGEDQLPEATPNLSDGSTKVMSNDALRDMGLEVPAWRTGEFPEESFADADAVQEPPTVVPLVKGSDVPPAPVSDEAAARPGGAPPFLKQDKLDFSGLNVGPVKARPESLPLPAFDALPAPSLSAPPAVQPTSAEPVPEITAPVGPPKLEAPQLDAPKLDAPKLPEPVSSAPLRPVADPVPPKPVAGPVPSAPKKPVSQPAANQQAGTTEPAEPKSNLLLILLISYASAVTLALLYLLMSGGGGGFNEHRLESLPDVAPEGPKELTYVPPDTALAPGHRLQLGDKRRFGNIVVEPLRVSMEPVQFQHYTGSTKQSKPASAPVLKLWVRLTNVSSSQTIAPLDAPLLLKWVAKKGESMEYTNQYLFPSSQDSRDALVPIYRMPVATDWDIVGQNLGKELGPGESIETFIASTDDGSAQIEAPVTWRVQMRKGFSHEGNGVTTIFEVVFDWDRVERRA